MNVTVKEFYEKTTGTLTYVVYDAATKDAIVIDPLLDLDTFGWRTSTTSVETVENFVKENGLKVHWALDTHIHADHITGTAEIRKRLGAQVAISEAVKTVQETFAGIFHLENFPCDGSQFDRLLKNGDLVEAGSIKIEILHTPGHTPVDLTYKIGNNLFVGDVLFMDDIGVARCDFPNGSAENLYDSVMNKIYSLPDDTLLHTGHDYPEGRAYQFSATVGACKKQNKDLRADTNKAEFVKRINDLDAKRPAPRLLFPSLQCNIRGGAFPEPESNNVSYLKFPFNFL